MPTNENEPSVSSSGSCAQAEEAKPAHTPGPWPPCNDGECECGLIWSKEGNVLVAKACGTFEQHMPTPDEPERTANHKLIAAAPDLLEAAKIGLKFVRKWKRYEEENEPRMDGSAWPETLDAEETLEGVIAKAEGEA